MGYQFPAYLARRLGLAMNRTQFDELTIDEIFEYWDGPLVYTCKSPKGERYFAFNSHWGNGKDKTTRWIYFPITDAEYKAFVANPYSDMIAVLKSRTQVVQLTIDGNDHTFADIDPKTLADIETEILNHQDKPTVTMKGESYV